MNNMFALVHLADFLSHSVITRS